MPLRRPLSPQLYLTWKRRTWFSSVSCASLNLNLFYLLFGEKSMIFLLLSITINLFIWASPLDKNPLILDKATLLFILHLDKSSIIFLDCLDASRKLFAIVRLLLPNGLFNSYNWWALRMQKSGVRLEAFRINRISDWKNSAMILATYSSCFLGASFSLRS